MIHMVDDSSSPGSLPASDREALLAAAGRSELVDALHWIAEGRSLVGGVALSSLLTALVAAADAGVQGADLALRTAVRTALRSTLDTSADLVQTGTIVPPHRYQSALAKVASRTATGSLVDIDSAAVLAAQAEDPLVIETLGLVAGLSWRDLQSRSQARGVPLPSEADLAWNPSQVRSAFKVIDEVVRCQMNPQLPGAVAARPVELLLDGLAGWQEIEALRTGGVSYGTLLAQRDVGSAWSAHRNRSNTEISRLMIQRVLAALDEAGVEYWSTEGNSAVPKSFLASKVGAAGKTPGQLSVVIRGTHGAAGYAVLVAIARDGGTARKTAATLLELPKRLEVPAALILFGTGWADRGESDDLVRAYGGRIYNEHTLTDLVLLSTAVRAD